MHLPPPPEDGMSQTEKSSSPSERMEPAEIDSFVKFVLSEVATRPEVLLLREVSSVVRYIQTLVIQGLPRELLAGGAESIAKYRSTPQGAKQIRGAQAAWRMAEIIWRTLMMHGRIERSSKAQALAFLKRHEKTYLANPYFEDTVEFLKSCELPPDAAPAFAPPHLISQLLSEQGEGNPYLPDDLTERIAAAYYVLRKVGIRNATSRIAQALDESEATRYADTYWGADEVRIRIKTYRRRKDAMPSEDLANLWIFYWHRAEEVRKENSGGLES
jgi:hypothetical protein